MDDILIQRLNQLERDHFGALVDEQLLVTFQSNFAKLSEDLEINYQRRLVSTETVQAVYEFASRLEISFQRTSQLSPDAGAPSDDEIQKLFSDLTIDMSAPSFERMALTWLVLNVANPYPSKKQKSKFCQDSGAGADQVERWFRRVRRDIGWTSLCNDRFAGSKRALVDAWDRITNAPSLDDDVAFELLSSFSDIQSRAHALHASAASSSPSTIRQAEILVVASNAQPSAPKKRSRSADYEVPMEKTGKRTRFSSAPKPSSPISAKLSSEPPVVSLKRRRSSSDEDVKTLRRPPPPKPTTISLKRSRSPEDEAAEPLAAPQQSIVSRKRRLSDSDSHVQRKRPFGQVKTRLHAVSDPLIAFSALPEIIPKAEEVKLEPSEASSPGPLFPSSFEDSEVPADAPIILSQSATSSLFCQDPSALPPLSMSSPYISESSPLEISICHWPLESSSPSATAKTTDLFPLPDFLPPLFNDFPVGQGAMDFLSLPSADSPCPDLEYSPLSSSPCPELDYSSSTSPSVAESPLPAPPLLQCDEISEKLKQLQEHQEAVRKLEAEILCSTVLAAVA